MKEMDIASVGRCSANNAVARKMPAQEKIQTRLCPRCANSIGADALNCPYCKADLIAIAEIEPQWPRRIEDLEPPAMPPEKEKLTVKSKAILVFGLVVFAFGIYLVGGTVEHRDIGPQLIEQQLAIKEKDDKIKDLEAQLVQLRQSNQGTSQEIEQLKARLEKTQKDLVAAQNKLTGANREIARLSTSRIAPGPRPAARAIDPPPTVSARPGRTAEPRTYETLRTTQIYEAPSNTARVIAQVGRGTQIAVVSSASGWLEIRSKHGKPPGFIRADDAMFLSKAN
jgi:cell division protein FtsB